VLAENAGRLMYGKKNQRINIAAVKYYNIIGEWSQKEETHLL